MLTIGIDLAASASRTAACWVKYEVNPLIYPVCGGRMVILALIEQEAGIFRIEARG